MSFRGREYTEKERATTLVIANALAGHPAFEAASILANVYCAGMQVRGATKEQAMRLMGEVWDAAAQGMKGVRLG